MGEGVHTYRGYILAGAVAFASCVTQAAGPVCAAAAATGNYIVLIMISWPILMDLILFPATATCAATAWLPPLFCACVSGLIAATCGVTCAACIGAFFAPTP